jgi:hypothetical protein
MKFLEKKAALPTQATARRDCHRRRDWLFTKGIG